MERPVFDADEAEAGKEKALGKLPHWASNLEDNVDKQLLIMLRDGRKLIGWLRTFDQFANLLVEQTVERHILCEEKVYADVYLGTMMIRGENVCLFGEVDGQRPQGPLSKAPLDYVLQREADMEAADAARGIQQPIDIFADPSEW
uniref:U6 snRNA-associated Sm-like protein LSm1 n=1 Tax=Alexandrium catenella TaxID=2925 RepID=A0A7S1RHM5_ALECA|mmetsp:Transcript_58741/g.157374  ORF Transcript_58741/g.157374 Transcript_58741/m.157374 type:complete len:145 (+) Transcript_58741:90-524(+)|eukprot:CAMPEP_0171206102 /NCGR_PEP_ID=MMETSP0790-20130122/26889_1 /TAXON_ID=2925 /ORGANISM="Alexandrium catenella, Strain OF101" /LENGTH=144 /DNA_ID=CAMNT_0011671635 /DNA_START=90 /DNA_END=521 /DNA_ORIENTATION=-